jgi:hypothetical protein
MVKKVKYFYKKNQSGSVNLKMETNFSDQKINLSKIKVLNNSAKHHGYCNTLEHKES